MRVYENTAIPTTLNVAIDESDATIELMSTSGWPEPTGVDIALAAIDYGTSKIEIVSYTDISGTSLTGVIRGLDGTTAQSHAKRARVVHIVSAKDIEQLRIDIDTHIVDLDPHAQYLTQDEGDGLYSDIGHNHDLDYADISHDHSGVYSPVGHDHAGVYDPAGSASSVQGNLTAHIDDTSNAHDASAISYSGGATPALVATNVQDAINEIAETIPTLNSDYVNVTGDIMTGNLEFAPSDSSIHPMLKIEDASTLVVTDEEDDFNAWVEVRAAGINLVGESGESIYIDDSIELASAQGFDISITVPDGGASGGGSVLLQAGGANIFEAGSVIVSPGEAVLPATKGDIRLDPSGLGYGVIVGGDFQPQATLDVRGTMRVDNGLNESFTTYHSGTKSLSVRTIGSDNTWLFDDSAYIRFGTSELEESDPNFATSLEINTSGITSSNTDNSLNVQSLYDQVFIASGSDSTGGKDLHLLSGSNLSDGTGAAGNVFLSVGYNYNGDGYGSIFIDSSMGRDRTEGVFIGPYQLGDDAQLHITSRVVGKDTVKIWAIPGQIGYLTKWVDSSGNSLATMSTVGLLDVQNLSINNDPLNAYHIVYSGGATPALAATDVEEAINELAADIAGISLTAGAVSFTPYGNIASTTVQAAIQELDDEKAAAGHNHDSTYVNVTGDTMTGALMVDGGADAVQLTIQANATQNAALLVLEDSAGVDLSYFDGAGRLALPNGTAGTATGSIYGAADTNTGLRWSGSDEVIAFTNGTDRLTIGTTLINTTLNIGSSATNYIGFGAGSITLYSQSGGNITFSNNGSTRMIIGSTSAITISDGVNFVFNATTGTKLGTATNQKLGFYNATPIVRPAGWAAASGTATRTSFNTATASVEEIAQRLKAVIDDLIALGLVGA